MGGIQVTVLQKYEAMIEEAFRPMIDLANLIFTTQKKKVEKQLEKEMGIDVAKKQLAKLEEEKNDIEEKLLKLCGNDNWQSKIKTSESPFGKELERRVQEKNSLLSQLLKKKKELIDQIWLDRMSSSMRNLLDNLEHEIIPSFVKKLEADKKKYLSKNGKGNKVKALPSFQDLD